MSDQYRYYRFSSVCEYLGKSASKATWIPSAVQLGMPDIVAYLLITDGIGVSPHPPRQEVGEQYAVITGRIQMEMLTYCLEQNLLTH